MFDNVNIRTNTPANIIEITNNDMESYIKKAENLVELSRQSSNKAGAFVEQSKTVLNECKKVFGEMEDEIESLGAIHATRTDNPHSVTAEQVGAYSKEEIDSKSFLTAVPEEYVTQTELENKSYLTSSDITDLATKIELVNGLELKQSKLIAGNNIKIENDVISTSFDVANIDLSNLSEQGSKVIDGQWVNKISKLSSELSQGLYEVDLKTSGYLPNDNYCYEVFIYGYCYRATSNATNVFVYSDILGNDSAQSFMSVKASSSNNAIVVPVNKKIYIKLTSALTDASITSMGYRRIGTNQ